MKTRKLFIVALIAALILGGLVMAGCRILCDGEGTCEVKSGKGSYCSNINSYGAGCAATRALYVTGGDGKCDC
jgi:hypothetical protein